MMLRNILVALSFALFLSCSSSVEKKSLNGLFIGSGIERYFLADLPGWRQFSSHASCRFEGDVRYLNYESLGNSYSLEYEQLAQFQYIINQEFSKADWMESKNQEQIFYGSYEKIKGGSVSFRAPEYKTINLIWIDDIINNRIKIKKLKKVLAGKSMQSGYPVFVSKCLSDSQFYKFIHDNSLASYSTVYIPREMFSPYNTEFKLVAQLAINFKKFFKDTQKIHFFSTRKYETTHFSGYEKFHTYQ